MTARQSAGHGIVAVPVDLGQALAFPGVYLEAPAGLRWPAPAPRRRRPDRARRTVAALATVAAAAGLMLAGCASAARHAPAPSGTPWIGPQAAQAMAAVPRPELIPDRHERHERHVASERHAARIRQVPASVPVTVIAGPPRSAWDGRGTYDSGTEPLCPAYLAGHSAMAGPRGHKFAVVCAWDGTEYAWGAK